MRPVRLCLVVAPLCVAIGCSLFEKNKDNPTPATPVKGVTANKLVDYLNSQASRLQSLRADVELTARENLLPHTLSGSLAARQPQDFRMIGTHALVGAAAKVDLGSNSDQFWVFMQVPSQKPLYVYASHTDFDAGRARLPDGIAFEPEWVMQALGMHIFPTNTKYDEPRQDTAKHTFTLSWQSQTPTNVPIIKEVVFDSDETRDGKPHVKQHVIRDSKRKVICTATIENVGTVQVGSMDPNAPKATVQYPTRIKLKWEIQKFELDLTLTKVQVNQRFTEEESRTWFSKPRPNPGVDPVDLARGEISLR